MNRDEAREILSVWRPWAKDAQSAEFADALAFARQDPELAAWLEEHVATQEAIRSAFKQIEVPAGLKEQILSERDLKKIVPLERPDPSRRVQLYALAASVVLVCGVAVYWSLTNSGPKEDVGFNGYRNRMVASAVRTYIMDMESGDASAVRAYLSAHKGHADFAMPEKVSASQIVGCGIKSWQGKPVTMVCFKTGKRLPPGEKSDLFLFVVDRGSLTELPEANKLVYRKVNELATATWTEGDRVYLLTSPNEATLKEFLPGKVL